MNCHHTVWNLLLGLGFQPMQVWSWTISTFFLSQRQSAFILLLWIYTQPNNIQNIKNQYEYTLTIFTFSVPLCSLLDLCLGLYAAHLLQHQLVTSSSSPNVRSKQLIVEVLGCFYFGSCIGRSKGKGGGSICWYWKCMRESHRCNGFLCLEKVRARERVSPLCTAASSLG